MMQLLRYLVGGSLLLLGGCSGLQSSQPDHPSWHQQRAQVAQLQDWAASGKIALRTAEQAESASLIWQQSGVSTHIRLTGPLGFSATTLDSDGEQLEIRQGDDYSRWALDDPALADNEVWGLPLRALHYWLKGIPAPQLPVDAITLDASGSLPSEITQQGWVVEYQEFGQFERFTLPTKLRLYRGDVSARILLRQWQGLYPP